MRPILLISLLFIGITSALCMKTDSGCDCDDLKVSRKNKASTNWKILQNNLDCFEECWREKKLKPDQIAKYFNDPYWFDDYSQVVSFKLDTDTSWTLTMRFIHKKFVGFGEGYYETREHYWKHFWYRSKMWKEAVLDSIIYQPIFLLDSVEQIHSIELLKNDLQLQNSNIFNEPQTKDSILMKDPPHIRIWEGDRKYLSSIEDLKFEVKLMNWHYFRKNDLELIEYFIDFYEGMSQHGDLRAASFEFAMTQEPDNVPLKLSAAEFYMTMYKIGTTHRHEGDVWRALNPNKEVLTLARAHLEDAFDLEPDNPKLISMLLKCVYWMDDWEVGKYYRNRCNSTCESQLGDSDLDVRRAIDLWIKNGARGFWGAN